MKLVEKHIIRKTHKYYKEVDELCFRSKNLYNYANYMIRQKFISEGIYLNYYTIQKQLQGEKQADYIALPAKVSQQTLKVLDKNWQAFFKAMKSFVKKPELFSGCPKLPKYKHKTKGRFPVYYTIQAVSKTELINKTIKLSKTNISFHTKAENILQVRIIPRQFYYVIEVVYEKVSEAAPVLKNSKMSIDFGIDNLATCFMNHNLGSFIINGKPVKAMNQFYNKRKARLQSQLPEGKFCSNRIRRLSLKRQCKLDDYFHKASKLIVDKAIENKVSEIIIGKNDGWKQKTNIGSRNNQNFVTIPFLSLISKITYKAEMLGIKVTLTEESYTSKTDHLVDEDFHEKQRNGKRVNRGLFQSASGVKVNADVNGAIGIMRKVVPVWNLFQKGISGVVVHPIRVSL